MTALQHAESADGTRIAYRSRGDGEPVLFVHGTGTSGADWAFVGARLEDRFTMVAMDRRGRGESGDAPAYSMEREAEDVLAVLEATGSELLVGHSYGALCSALAAARTDRLRKLVLYEPPVGVRTEFLAGVDELVAQGRHEEILERFLEGAGVRAQELEAIRSSPAWPVLLDAVPALPRELHAATRWTAPPGPIGVPLLYMIGAETTSPAYTDGLDDLLAAFPDHRRVEIAGQLHIAHVLAAPQFADLVGDFLAS
jgi:pimeloyl-ACP methyl ester carboxylesterase